MHDFQSGPPVNWIRCLRKDRQSNAKLVGLQKDTANPNINQLPRDIEATAHMCENKDQGCHPQGISGPRLANHKSLDVKAPVE